jgi:hypothetical protein
MPLLVVDSRARSAEEDCENLQKTTPLAAMRCVLQYCRFGQSAISSCKNICFLEGHDKLQLVSHMTPVCGALQQCAAASSCHLYNARISILGYHHKQPRPRRKVVRVCLPTRTSTRAMA